MKENKIRIVIISVIGALVILGALVLLTIESEYPTFVGNRIKNPDAYLLTFDKMNGTDSHDMELKSGDVLEVYLEPLGGTLDVKVGMEGCKSIYQANDASKGEFKLNITESGTYTISIDAKKAKGTANFTVKKD